MIKEGHPWKMLSLGWAGFRGLVFRVKLGSRDPNVISGQLLDTVSGCGAYRMHTLFRLHLMQVLQFEVVPGEETGAG